MKNLDAGFSCVICDSKNIAPLLNIPQMPVYCNVLWPTQESAQQAPRGDINLAYCFNCGHLFNAAFEPALITYTPDYENSLHFSLRFQNYAESLATRLVARYQLRDKNIIEIGCGQGDFLKLLCRRGQSRGVGFDPSYIAPPDKETTAQLTFVQDYYSQKYAHYPADLIVCRHVLEHIAGPVAFLATVRQAIGKNKTALFFEVPNALSTLRDLAVWDIIYEHCAYFTSHSLAYLFSRLGFTVTSISEAFDGQFLCLEAAPQPANVSIDPDLSGLSKIVGTDRECGGYPPESPPVCPKFQKFGTRPDLLAQISQYALAFADNHKNRLQNWRIQFDELTGLGQKTVIWGAGSKGVTFLNMLDTQHRLEFAVDINPRKHGKYIPGAGQQIVPPEFLKRYRPDTVIAMNPIYKDEIGNLLENMGLANVAILPAT